MKNTIFEKTSLLNDVISISLDEYDELTVIQNFTNAGIAMLNADFGFVLGKRNEADEYKMVYQSTPLSQNLCVVLALQEGDQTLSGNEPVFIENAFKDNHPTNSDNHSCVSSYVVIPIVYENDFLDSIVLCYEKTKNFTDEDKTFMELFSKTLTQAIHVCRLHSRLEDSRKALGIGEQNSSGKNAQDLANYDSVTGLPNRTLLNERIKEAQALAEQHKNMYALFFIDLDRFKIINDIYGHQTGDLLLKQVARRMQKLIPKNATLARMGGDEFLVLLPNISTVEEAEKCASKIQEVFGDFFEINQQEIYFNGSIGFAIFPLDGIDHSTLLKNAGLALNRAKEYGGGNIQQYRIGLPLFYTMQPKLQSQLRKAIKNNELVLHFQPILGLKNKKIIGSEALVRWNHPEMGLLSPGAFIEQAEESGLIVEIGEWVLEAVCKQIKIWESTGRVAPSVSINISPRELLKPTLVTRIQNCLQKYAVDPTQIKVELTETFLIKNIDLSISILEQLKALGLKILIDDFGTGYASLNYLKRLPINGVKIDKTFIHGVPNNLQDAALTAAIIAIAHQLGLDVVGEGVENRDQYDFLSAAKCNFAQGNFLHKPLTGDEFAKLVNLS